MGSLRYSSAKKINLTAQAHHSTLDYELQELIARFWTQEKLLTNTSSKLSKEEEECERYFLSTHSRDASGRYTVRLCLKLEPTLLGDSRTPALNALNRLSRRFSSNSTFQKLYSDFVEEKHGSYGES